MAEFGRRRPKGLLRRRPGSTDLRAVARRMIRYKAAASCVRRVPWSHRLLDRLVWQKCPSKGAGVFGTDELSSAVQGKKLRTSFVRSACTCEDHDTLSRRAPRAGEAADRGSGPAPAAVRCGGALAGIAICPAVRRKRGKGRSIRTPAGLTPYTHLRKRAERSISPPSGPPEGGRRRGHGSGLTRS